MGAKARAWVNRGLVVLAIAAGVALVVALPGVPAAGKAAILVTAALVGAVVAFREIPAFDPLGRVHWRLPPGENVPAPSPSTTGRAPARRACSRSWRVTR